MFVTVECEAMVVGCRSIRAELDATLPCVLALPGADHVLETLPTDRWALISAHPDDAVRTALVDSALPVPACVIVAPDGGTVEHYLAAAEALSTDPHMCMAFEDSEAGVSAAREAGMQVVGIAAHVGAATLDAADFVVPSLLSVRVLGAHPFMVFEVDAAPDIGTHASRRR